MLNKVLYNDERLVRVPNIAETMYVDRSGKILIDTPEGFVTHTGDKITVTLNVGAVEVSVLNVIQITWKPVYLGDIIHYLTRKVEFIDGDSSNRSPTNLSWGFEVSMVDGMYRVPGFSRYLLTPDYRIYNRESKKFIAIYNPKNLHSSVYAKPDYAPVGNTTSVHRFVAFALIEYPHNAALLDVNHINGNKWDYAKENLEWCTRSENNTHAQRTGLKKDGNKILVTNTKTHEVTEHYSQATAAVAIGIDYRYLSLKLTKGGGLCSHNGYVVQLLSRGKPKGNTQPMQVFVKNTLTGEVSEFASLSAAAKFLGMTYHALKARHVRNSLDFGKYIVSTSKHRNF